MAKWGKGDPRWLVEERPDATNVNNWHWAEKNASYWSRQKLFELLVGLEMKSDLGIVKITEMLKCEGDAVVNNRKGKLIFFYEWNIELKWRGETYDGINIEGKIAVLNMTEEQSIKDVNIIVHFKDDGAESTAFGSIIQNQGNKKIKEMLSVYITALKEDFARNLILPTRDMSIIEMPTEGNKKIFNQWLQNEQKSANKEMGGNFAQTELYDVQTFKCTAEELYRVLTIKDFVQVYAKDCVLEGETGGKFELFDGHVRGYFVKLEPFEVIVLKWKLMSWPIDHFSDVYFNIHQKNDCTELRMTQFGVPEEEVENTKEGWKRYYWNNIRNVFGFGSFLC